MLSSLLRTLFAWGLGVPNTVFWGSLSLLGSLVDRSGGLGHRCMVNWSRINLWLIGLKVEVTGLEHVLRDRPQLFAANHQSLVDILVLAANLPVPFRFVAKKSLFDIPFLGWHMTRSGFISIDRGKPRQAARALLTAVDRIKSGVNALIFPEGTRSPDATLLPFRTGGFLLAIRAGVRVVPIVITGTAAVVKKGTVWVRPASARLRVLPPLDSAKFDGDREALSAAVRQAIAGELQGSPASEGV